MPSVGRKFLVAGKSGLNLTHDEPWEHFLAKYHIKSPHNKLWQSILSEFDNNALRAWASDLGIETFTASSGKVFPIPVDGIIRAAPLLRRWCKKLRKLGVIFKMRHRWQGFAENTDLLFEHRSKQYTKQHDATLLALGGGSWPNTGSDGNWVNTLDALGIQITPLQSANCGWNVDWPAAVSSGAEGLPLKNLQVSAGSGIANGELVITRYGLEGAPIYRLGPSIRSLPSPEIIIDFKPNLSHEDILSKMGNVERNFIREARRRLKLDTGTCSLLKHLPNRGPWKNTHQLAYEIKNCRIPLTSVRPLSEAISTAGGISWQEVDEKLMLKKIPSVYLAGEMIDWEAPTGGYLLQACFATGTYVGKYLAAEYSNLDQ